VKDSDFELLVTSVKQAGRIKRGEMEPARKLEVRAEDVKAIRAGLNKSQAEFALMIGVSVSTLQNWEQGRRQPEGPARALLRVAAANPAAVAAALDPGQAASRAAAGGSRRR
jgi:putative transcriptional regulator